MNDISTGPENWFYVREGRRQGPFTRALLVRELLALEAPEGALVWRGGLPAWTKAGLVDELRRELPPPVPGTLPLPLPEPDQPVPDLPPEESREDDPTAPNSDPGDRQVTDGDFVPESGEGQTQTAEGGSGARRRRRQRSSRKHKTSGMPSYALPLALLFIAVVIALWFLLRRMNEVPAGRIILQGEVSAPADGGDEGSWAQARASGGLLPGTASPGSVRSRATFR